MMSNMPEYALITLSMIEYDVPAYIWETRVLNMREFKGVVGF